MDRIAPRTAAVVALGIAWALVACERPAPGPAASADGVAAALPGARSTAPDGADVGAIGDVVLVYRSPTCGCCGGWVEHLRENGFTVEVEDVSDMAAVKRRLGVPGPLTSCHTAVVGGRVVEGHVPADALQRFLEDQRWSGMAGLAVPGMPSGSPGMETPGRTPQPYDIVAWDSTGATVLFERRGP